MRLAAIDRPPILMARIAYWLCARQLGRVITRMRVVYARMPALFPLAYRPITIERKRLTLDKALSHVAMTLGGHAERPLLRRHRESLRGARASPLEKFHALPDWRSSPLFQDRERAALAYVEEATKARRVSDATFATLRKHFSEPEIVELTWLNALENYDNLINVPLKIEQDGLCAIAQGRVAARGG